MVIPEAVSLVSSELANPFIPTSPEIKALIAVVEPEELNKVPLNKVPVTPASLASGHKSPSESKSLSLVFPSPSVSTKQVGFGADEP